MTTEFSASADPFRLRPAVAAPSFLRIETPNVLSRYARLGRIRREAVLESVMELDRVVGDSRPDELLLGSAIALAVELRHSLYDCLYLALAIETRDAFATADKRLAVLARQFSIETHLIEATS